MQTLFQKMRANRGRWIKPPIQAAEVQPAPEVPFMVVDGERFMEAPADSGCNGCELLYRTGSCDRHLASAMAAFGRDCFSGVIYIKAE